MLSLHRVASPAQFKMLMAKLADWMLLQPIFDRGEVHAQKTTTPDMQSRELNYVTLEFMIPPTQEAWQVIVQPNLPWAEDHFKERISGEPLNPPPAEAWWPYAQQGNAAHKKEEVFSHSYPERIWPKNAGRPEGPYSYEGLRDHNQGIRFPYGDLDDLIEILRKNPRSRQAYLPIWFPEDLTAAREGERVPCTLGYHFMVTGEDQPRLNMMYPMRSCDMVRFLTDDIYMAGRLLQHVGNALNIWPGMLVLTIANLHTFQGDVPWLEAKRAHGRAQDRRSHYNLDALS